MAYNERLIFISIVPGYFLKKTTLKTLFIAFGICFTALASPWVTADHILPTHKLNCSSDFPCPKELQRRIDFWIHVFKGWSKTQAIFHDPNKPERVYSVIDTGEGCSSRAKSTIKKERKRIKTNLYNTAKKLESGASMTKKEAHYAALFAGSKPSVLRNASENVRCQSGVRDSYLAGLKRFNRYSFMVDSILEQYQLPSDIRYLPFVESSYNPAAYSKVGAAGMWQIMPRTARTLGLELNATIDERLDPEAATHGAARYLVNSRKSLTELARSIDPGIKDEEISPFVITSYNYGVNGMRRAIKQVKPDYLSVLDQYKSPAFQVAVKNFYSSFLAARHVALNSEKYFGDVAKAGKLQYQTLVLENATSVERISKVFKVSEQDLKPINLGLTRFVWNGWRMIPAGYQLKLPYRSSGYDKQIAQLKSLTPETVAPGSENYVVRKGDTACGIARALQVNCQELIRMNQLGKRALIRVGQKLEIPGKLVAVTEPASRGQDKTVVKRDTSSSQAFSYTVRRGDTACGIASKNGVSCRELIATNKLGRTATIYIGQKLVIPGKVSVAGQVAGLDENNRYLVRNGDSACNIARRFSVGCNEFKKLNKLNNRATIYPGQRLKIPGLEVPETTETVEQLAKVDEAIEKADSKATVDGENVVTSPELSNLLDTLPDLRLSVAEYGGQPVYRIWVEADETMGHYADWLGSTSTREIRSLNKLKQSQLRIGQLLQLPISSGAAVEQFENKRTEYHLVLSEELKSHYSLVGLTKYTVRAGDTVWSLSKDSGFPVWLFYRLNPQFKILSLRVGQSILLPDLQQI
jgi:membrane-bound lytic murein transglycosylase D